MNEITVHSNFPAKPWKGSRVEVRIKALGRATEGRTVEVTIYPQRENLSKITSYGVNWPSLGTVDSESAALFADAVGRAAVEAQRLTNEYAGKVMD